MKRSLYKSKFFPVEGSKSCACVIAGYRGRIIGYKQVIKLLNQEGYSVIAYEHNPSVLTCGDPQQLLHLVDQICKDFERKTANFDEIICIGASIGAGLCFAVQRSVPRIKFGIFAGAGVSPPQNIFEAPLFYFVRKKFAKRGLNSSELSKIWKDIDILPAKPLSKTPFVIALGTKDKIVKYDKAVHTLQTWQDTGQKIKIVPKANLGHIGIIRWYKKHMPELLADAKGLTL